MSNKDFFKNQTPSSRIKASIVAEYFPKYCKILLHSNQEKIVYMDLFAGPGKYEDSKLSTPLLIADACARDPQLASKVQLAFNDNTYSKALKQNFDERFNPSPFKNKPRFGDKTVGEDEAIHKYLMKEPTSMNTSPTLLYFDPWGYKGIDTLALAKFLSHWGNEIFLFVNIKRIHAAIENNKFDELMLAIFPTTIEELKKNRKYKATVQERLHLIIEHIAGEFATAVAQHKSQSKLYHCAFKFQEEDSNTTSHFIIHFTKHSKGYELVKQIYYDFDNIGATLEKEGVYSFDAKKMGKSDDLAFGDANLRNLADALIKIYKHQRLSVNKLFEEHHIKTKYCASHYVKTLRKMVEEGKVIATFTDNISHKVTVLKSENCIVEFK